MADDEGERTTTTEPRSEAMQPETKSGWLLKRSKMSRQWKKKWFELKGSTVFYGSGPGVSALSSVTKMLYLFTNKITELFFKALIVVRLQPDIRKLSHSYLACNEKT